MLPPGLNNPAGVDWIALNNKGIGINGTDEPDSIGPKVSHGHSTGQMGHHETSRAVKRRTNIEVLDSRKTKNLVDWHGQNSILRDL